MITLLTKVSQEKLEVETTKKYSSLQLRNNKPKKYVSVNSTVESKQEIQNRGRDTNEQDELSIKNVFLKFILTTLQFTYITWIALKTLHAYIYTIYISKIRHQDTIYQRIHYDKSKLTKIPGHLSLILSRELLSTRTLKDWEAEMFNISMATCWAWEYGIKEISVYDASGAIKSMAVDLYKQQSRMLHEWIKNNHEKENKTGIQFTILSNENGKHHMAKITREIAASSSVDDMNIQFLDKCIHENNISDPELMIVYDGLPHNYVALDGFNPWQIKSTEIINCSNYHRLNYELFSKCLYRYSNVEQRFGR